MAFVFFQLPHGLLAVSLMTTFAPGLASSAGRGDLRAFRRRFGYGLRLLVFAVAPASAGYVVLAHPLLSVLLERGAFSSASASRTATVLVGLAVGLVGFSVYLYVLRGFYALPDVPEDRRKYLEAAMRAAFDSEGVQNFNQKKYMHLIDSYRDTAGSKKLIGNAIETYKAVYREMGLIN